MVPFPTSVRGGVPLALRDRPALAARPNMGNVDMEMDPLRDLERRLRQAFSPVTWLSLADVSDGHAVEGFKDGRALRADGRDLIVLVVTTLFEGMSPLERQRLVNGVLADELATGVVHSLQARCWTPQQWQRKGEPRAIASQKGSTKAEPASPSSSPTHVTATLHASPPPHMNVLALPPCAARLPNLAARESSFCDGSCLA